MARRKKYNDEISKNSGGVGYSQAALDKLNAGTYGRDIGSKRQVQYRTSQEQTQQSRQLPVLEGLTRSNDWESSNKVDTVGARQRYAEKNNYKSIGKSLSNEDEELLYKTFDRNRLSSGGNAAIVHQLKNNIWHNTKDWEEKYGKTIEQIVEDYSKDYEKIAEKRNTEKGKNNKVLTTLTNTLRGGTVEPALDTMSTLAGKVAPNSPLTQAYRNAAEKYSKQKKQTVEGVTGNMSRVGKQAYELGTGLGERAIQYANPSALKYVLTAGKTAENTRQSLKERGIEGTNAEIQSGLAGLVDAGLDIVGLESVPALKGLVDSGNIGKEVLGRMLIGGGEQGLTNLINNASDRLFNGDKSLHNIAVQNYINQGMTAEEAENQATKDEAYNLAEATVSGGLLNNLVGFGGRMLGNVPSLFKRSDTTRADVPKTESTQPDVIKAAQAQTAQAVDNINRLSEQIPDNSDRLSVEEMRALGLDDETIKRQLDIYNNRSQDEVRGLAGDDLKAAQDRVTSNKAQIKALENEIKIIESDPNNKYRGNLKKSAKADIESRKAQIAELKQDNKVTTRQIKGEPTPVIEQLDADSVTRINDFKKEVRKIGNMWGGEGGKQLAKDVNDALDRYIETGSREDLHDFRDKLYTLHDSATGEYTSKNGNVSRYSDYYGDRELGIYEDLVSGNSLLKKALREADNLRNAKQTTPDVETANNVPPTNPPMPTDRGSEPPSSGDRVRSFSRRGSNDDTLPDEIRNTLSEDFYNVVRNKDVEAKADSMFIPDNLIQTRSNLDRAVEDHDPTAALLSYKLAKAYVDNGDYDAATDVIQKVSEELTRMGQFTQAAKLAMLQNDPMAAMRSYMRDLEKLNQWGNKKYKNKWNDLELTQEDIDLINSVQKGDSEGLNAVFDSLNEKFSKQIPSTWWEKAVSASKTAMLLNLRTQSRNILANMATLPLRSASDRVAALGQNIAHLINDDVDVTQSLTGGTKAQKKIASEVFERFKDEITGDNKMKDSVKSDILSQRQIFNNDFFARWVDNLTNGGVQRLNERFGANGNQSTMETLQNFTYWLMGDFGDTPFVKKNFVNRLASYMKAQGIDNIDDIPDEAISIATQEALKATFKDDNRFTKALQGVKQKTGKFGEIALPFVKTPANLTMRAVDYSPAGIINTILKSRSGAEASAVIDDLSKNITGTALIYLGYKLAEKGILSGSYSQDKDEAAFQKQQGMLENAIHIGDNYYTYDWTQPASTPLVLGQTIYEAVKASDKENASIKDIVNATYKGGLRVANTIINSSPLQSLSDLLGESQYGEEGIAENIANEILEFPQRFIPSIMGATARTIDPVMRDTYIKDSTLTGALGNQARSAMAKVPFLSQTLPASYDTWGNERTRSDSKGEAFFAQMINPGQLGNKNETPLDGEIQRLFDTTGNKAVFPISAARSLDLGSDGNITLTNKQHSDYQRTMGQRSYSYAESIMNDAEYKSLSDDDKVKILEKAYKLSNDITKEEMFDHVTTNDKTLKEIARTGDSKAVAKALINGVKANELGMSLSEYQKKEDEQPGGAQAYVQKKKEAVDSGFVNKSSNADVKGYEKAISQAGDQSQKFVNDLPMLQQTGLEKSAYYTYANAINVIPSLTPSEFAQTYNEINTNTSNAMTQKELLDYLNKYQFSDDPAEDERIANELWRAYGGWTNKAGVEKKIKLQNGQWKSYY